MGKISTLRLQGKDATRWREQGVTDEELSLLAPLPPTAPPSQAIKSTKKRRSPA